ncbi:helix-turn-helix domain-containing protein [Kribbella sandramycini]|uniref:Helix-turn-helix domain-containing protein n=1 Tax=Kribbella sandramycini TaxID=60450 RepID=A0A7Y4NYE9_9ACTN|nr:helix-turn-helix domain-containing protein [Kribbella sandramycini]MBB6568328.1 putative ArsR family transcriptional regulator [Kribbella sandramycini]NOL39080.1 helix-turn-helix domain-containing protein [Kribbella sandramycini]
MDSSWDAGLQAVAVLEEPTRRRLYEYVVAQPTAVSRDDAAAALAIPRTTAAFHLDRLVDEGLLATCFERRTGRTGPGAGRPAKLYHRSDTEIEITLPERQYAVAGRLLAAAVQEAEATNTSPRDALNRQAHAYGASLARPDHSLVETLQANGFEPRADGADIALVNCPFRRLAADFTQLVCHMNLHLVNGLAEAKNSPLEAQLLPAAGHCCVRLVVRGRTAPTH